MELGNRIAFRDRSGPERLVIGAVVALLLAIVAVTERDIAARDPSELRGPKLLWRGVATNAVGALAYWAWGRRRSK
jgi:hypothetical protein